MNEEYKKGCEYGRLLETRVSVIEQKQKDYEERQRQFEEKAEKRQQEILSKFNNWWPKGAAFAFGGMAALIGSLITGIIAILSFR
jgi:hypothetical protein